MIFLKNEEVRCYLLEFDGKYWGVEYYADGYCSDCYGVVENIIDAKRFSLQEKPIEGACGRMDLKDFLDRSEFKEVIERIINTIEFLES